MPPGSWLSGQAFDYLLLFARIGAAMMILPGLSATAVSMRARLSLSLVMVAMLLPVLQPHLPPQPNGPVPLALLVISEVTIGIFLGMLTQTLLSALEVCGTFISYVVGLTNALTYDPVTQAQSQLMTGFLNTIGLALLLISETHHLMFRALVDSYATFVPGQWIATDAAAETLVRAMSDSFGMALRLAAPLVVFSLIFNGGLGLLNRLVPQIQVFFVGAPLQILLGLSLLMISLPFMMQLLLRHIAGGFALFGGG